MAIKNNPNPIEVVKAINNLETDKLSINLGSSSANKILVTNSSGNVTTGTFASQTKNWYKEQSLGDGTASSFTITHNWNVMPVHVTVVDATTGEQVIPDITQTTTSVVIGFSNVPSSNQYKVLISNPRFGN